MKTVILVLLAVIALTSCSGGPATFLFYVVIEPGETAKFIEAVRGIATEDGLETAVGQAVSDTGNVMRVVEGRGHGLQLWVQNAPLSGREDPTVCGIHLEPYKDPGQFLVFTVPRFFGSKAAARDLGERVFSQIRKSGFDARTEPAVCGAAALHGRP